MAIQWNSIEDIFFDLGDTLIHQVSDSRRPLSVLKLHLLDSTMSVLELAAAKARIGLISNTETTNDEQVEHALQKLGIAEMFASVTSSVTTGVKKPSPRIFELAMNKQGASASRSLMIGNDYVEDIEPAKKLGMSTILLTSKPPVPQGCPAADFVVGSSGQLFDLLHSSLK